ncbi:triphosphoribosyl-dephospho-CoA synthase CitG [uncultured Cohaesibacter sp.]|uniref:triphosphoribosyl-dephospho-CoA synthase CitG n=1 Tax=uncultured Cohaesibacter sp. TaxID=1002546 RepID=UPI0029C8DFC4|nr:triphosphoribosyl-dephospho-CoA synthase CitG [uncultured Cohaesibacter sp.]
MTKSWLSDKAPIHLPTLIQTTVAQQATGQVGHDIGLMEAALAELAHKALVAEATLTPKPGLVDRRNSGSHTDMSLETFLKSADALRPHFADFVRIGHQTAENTAPAVFEHLRCHGLVCEAAMNRATGDINTHKGAIFAFGLLLGAAGRASAHGLQPNPNRLGVLVAEMLSGLVERELAGPRHTATTAGEHIFRRYGLTGARGEAQSGFVTVRRYALPAFHKASMAGAEDDTALLAALLELLAHNRDTNIVARGGMDGLHLVRRSARRIRNAGGIHSDNFLDALIAMDDDLIAQNLSPGGSADLVAVTWFMIQLQRLFQPLMEEGEA